MLHRRRRRIRFGHSAPRARRGLRRAQIGTVCQRLTVDRLADELGASSTCANTAVRDLAERIAVRHDPALDRHYPAGRPAVVSVVLKDGRRFTREVIDVRGDHTNPTTHTERRAKATTLLEASLGVGQAASILRACDGLFAGGPLKPLTDALKGR